MIALKAEDFRTLEALSGFMVDGVAQVSTREIGGASGLSITVMSRSIQRLRAGGYIGVWRSVDRKPNVYKLSTDGRAMLGIGAPRIADPERRAA